MSIKTSSDSLDRASPALSDSDPTVEDGSSIVGSAVEEVRLEGGERSQKPEGANDLGGHSGDDELIEFDINDSKGRNSDNKARCLSCRRKERKYRNYSQTNGISFYFFSWMTNWIKLASKGKLKHEEFPDIPDCDFDQQATLRFGTYLDEYRAPKKCNKVINFIGKSRLCVLKVFRKNFLILFCFSIFNDIFEVFNIFLLKHVMKQKMPTTVTSLMKYLALVLLVLSVNLVDIVTDGHHHFYYRRLVLRIENLLFSFLFSRILSKNYYSINDAIGANRVAYINANGGGAQVGGSIESRDHWSVDSDTMSGRRDTDGSIDITMLPRLHHSSNLLDSVNNIKIDRTTSKLGKEEEGDARWRGEDDISLLNLALFDISEIAWGILKLVDLCTIPLKILIVGCWLYYQVGPTAIKAVVFILISSTLMVLSECQSAKLVKGYVTRIDDRISKTLIILENLTNFKMFRWINLCKDSVLMSRVMELQICMKRTILSSIGAWLGISLPNILALAVFLIYSTNNKNGVTLDPSFSIPLLHTLNHFIKPFRDLPSDLSDHLETTISCNRIETFLFSRELRSFIDTSSVSHTRASADNCGPSTSDLSPEDDETTTNSTSNGDDEEEGGEEDVTRLVRVDADLLETGRSTIVDDESNGKESIDLGREDLSRVEKRLEKMQEDFMAGLNPKANLAIKEFMGIKEAGVESGVTERDRRCVVKMKGATFSRGDKRVFNRIDFKLETRDKVIIPGSNISEKFLFTMALIDELRHTEGYYYNHYINEDVCTGIVSQNPWIPMGTVRDIILFGNTYNPSLYNRVVEVCQLEYDFASWKLRDSRFIDEGGQNLSTGQKVRISLARSLYTLYSTSPTSTATNTASDRTKKLGGSRGKADSRAISNTTDAINGIGSGKVDGRLIILDEIFTVLDPLIGLTIFKNLFGPEGILLDFTCVVTVQDSFLHILSGFVFSEEFKFYNIDANSVERVNINLRTTGGDDQVLSSYSRPAHKEPEAIWDDKNEVILEDTGVSPDETERLLGDAAGEETGRLGTESGPAGGIDEEEEEDEEKGKEDKGDEDEMTSMENQVLSASELFRTNKEGNIALVKWEHFVWYLKKVNLRLVSLVISVSFVAMLLNVGSDIVISKWTSIPSSGNNKRTERMMIVKGIYNSDYLQKLNFLYVFTFLTSCTIVLFLWRSLLEVQGTLNAAHKVYSSALNGVLKCPIIIFNKIPIGNINNRLSADQSYADYSIFRRFSHFMSSSIFTILTAISLCYLNPWTMILIPLLVLLSYFCVFKMYIPMSIFNMRSNLETRGNICSQFSQVISGSHVIKSLNNEEYVMAEFLYYLKMHQNTKFFIHAASSWTMIRLRILTYPLIVVNLLIPLVPLFSNKDFNSLMSQRLEQQDATSGSGLKRHDMVDGKVGLALTYSYKFAKLLKSTLNKTVELETEMCASQRLQELAQLDPDYNMNDQRIFDRSKLKLIDHNYVLGRIREVNNRSAVSNGAEVERGASVGGEVFFDYYEGLSVKKAIVKYDSKVCLDEISFKTGHREHLGLIGRTGAGKSTLLLSLGGLIKLESGSIKIDGKDISTVTNDEMRDLVAILPHTPPLLPGWTVRKYIDPEGEHKDEEILRAIRICKLTYLLRHILSSSNYYFDEGMELLEEDELDYTLSNSSLERGGVGGGNIMGSSSNASEDDGKDGLDGVRDYKGDLGYEKAIEEGEDEMRMALKVKITKERENNYTIVSDLDLQYLTLLRLYLARRKLRLILIDECYAVEKDNRLHLEPINIIINRLFRNNIVIIVAHQPESLSLCDRVLLLEDGKIVETDFNNQ